MHVTIPTRNFCEVILYRFIGHLNGDEIARGYFQQAGAAAHTHSSCSQVATARYVWGQINFKGHLATTVARSYTP
jgi:hypothetical protein